MKNMLNRIYNDYLMPSRLAQYERLVQQAGNIIECLANNRLDGYVQLQLLVV